MIIKRISVEKIKPAAHNPRIDLQPGDPDYEKLKRSIDEFDCVEPLVWNKRTGNLVGGHQRFKILLARGDAEVDVSVVDLGEAEEKALNIALNKISGDWDYVKLPDLLTELQELDMLELTKDFTDLYKIGGCNEYKSDIVDWSGFVNRIVDLMEKNRSNYYLKNDIRKYKI